MTVFRLVGILKCRMSDEKMGNMSVGITPSWAYRACYIKLSGATVIISTCLVMSYTDKIPRSSQSDML